MFGRYVLVERLGQREPSQRWLALDLELDRKLVLELRAVGDEEGRVLLDKAAGLARVSHPNVVTIHDVGEIDGQLYIAREYVGGEVLVRWLDNGPHSWREVLAVLRQVGEGLAAIHDAGLVHRAVRPTKIVLDPSGRASVLGLGLRANASDEPALAREVDSPMPPGVRAGAQPVGRSPAYRAPEVLRGEAGDARADQFSFCVILFEALHGVRPFAGASAAELLAAIDRGRSVEPPGGVSVPAWIQRVVRRGLAAAPDDRYPHMDALLAALSRSPVARRARRASALVLGLGGLALVAALVSAWSQRGSSCADASEAIAASWEPARVRASLEPHAAEIGRAWAVELVLGGLHDYADAWARASRQLCRDAEAERTTADLHAARTECLDRQLVALEVLAQLDWAPPELARGVVERPHAALRSLGDPRRCLELGGRAREVDEAVARARAELRLLLAFGSGDEVAAQDRLTRLGGEAVDELLRGQVAVRRGELERAREHFDGAASLAVLDEPRVAARAWIALAELELGVLGEGASAGELDHGGREVERLLDYAEALIGDGAGTELLELARVRGELALALERPELAQPSLDRALARIEADGAAAPDLAAALLELHAQLLELGGQSGAAADARTRAATLRG